MGKLFMFIMWLSAVLYLPIQIATSVYARGIRRVLSFVSIPLAIVVAIVMMWGFSTESNLWPIWRLLVCPWLVAGRIGCAFAERCARHQYEMNSNPSCVE